MCVHNAVGILNEQRTGKTPTAIALTDVWNIQRVLIVCPASMQVQWKKEYNRWARRPAFIIAGSGAKKKKEYALWLEQGGAGIISYDTLKTTCRSEGMVSDILKDLPDCVILDEAHRCKTHSTAIAKAVFKLIPIPRRIVLTGTPAPNKPEEVWSILHFLKPMQFASYWKFVEYNFYTHKQQGQAGNTFTNIGKLKPGHRYLLQQVLSGITVQRKRIEVMPWLPSKDYDDIQLPLTKEQSKYLKELTDYFETEHIITRGILDRLVRYRQICLAPELLNLKGSSPKLDWLRDYIKDYPDTPTIVFTKFSSVIPLIKKHLSKVGVEVAVLVGSTSIKDRAYMIENFQNGKLNYIIANIDAAKEGLTLDRGECIIFLDQYPPASDIAQAEDRFVATTEARANKPHRIIRLMMADSYDAELYRLVQERADETAVINDYNKFLRGAR